MPSQTTRKVLSVIRELKMCCGLCFLYEHQIKLNISTGNVKGPASFLRYLQQYIPVINIKLCQHIINKYRKFTSCLFITVISVLYIHFYYHICRGFPPFSKQWCTTQLRIQVSDCGLGKVR